MTISVDALKRRILDRLSRAMKSAVSADVGRASGTLRDYLEAGTEIIAGKAFVQVPHYWAVYLHDGRGAFGPRQARWLVYFLDVRDDPRVAAGYPIRASQIRRLTSSEWQHGLMENARRRVVGERPYMIFTKSVGPAKGERFFSEPLASFDPLPIMEEEFLKYLASIGSYRRSGTAVFKI